MNILTELKSLEPEIKNPDELYDLKDCDDSKFRLQQQKVFLTYKTLLDKEDLISFFNKLWKLGKMKKTNIKFIRCAHEISSKKVEYEHTHVLIDFGEAFSSKNCRIFDYEAIHPNIKKVTTSTHWDRALNYIAKQDEDNADLKKENKWFNLVADCDSLAEAIQKCGGKPTDMAGIKIAYDVLHKAPSKESELKECRPWQQYLVDYIHEKVNRDVIWIYDDVGSIGKSMFTKHLSRTFPDKVLTLTSCGGEYHMASVIQWKLSQAPDFNTVVLDLARANEDAKIYAPLECLKNGNITVLKYQGQALDFERCHVIVMANFLPALHMMSKDRWKIYTVDPCTLTLKVHNGSN